MTQHLVRNAHPQIGLQITLDVLPAARASCRTAYAAANTVSGFAGTLRGDARPVGRSARHGRSTRRQTARGVAAADVRADAATGSSEGRARMPRAPRPRHQLEGLDPLAARAVRHKSPLLDDKAGQIAAARRHVATINAESPLLGDKRWAPLAHLPCLPPHAAQPPFSGGASSFSNV